MKTYQIFLTIVALIFGAFAGAAPAQANMSMLDNFNYDQPAFKTSMPFATTHAVIQVSEDDPARWSMVLNNAQNLLDSMGASKIQIVVVTYGPGLKMILASSPLAERIAALDKEGVEFDACHNTMLGMAKATGTMPVIVPEAVIVPAGVLRILQLESHGFLYLKP